LADKNLRIGHGKSIIVFGNDLNIDTVNSTLLCLLEDSYNPEMEETLNTAVRFSIQIAIVITMLSMGLQVTGSQILAAVSRKSLMAKALLANLILVPLVAFLLIRLFGLPEAVAAGILVVAAAPGAPLIPKYAEIAKGDLPFSVGLMFVLSVLAIVTAPLTIDLFLSASDAFSFDVLAVVKTLVLYQLAPLLVGLGIKWFWPAFGARLLRPSVLLSNIMVILVIILVLVRDYRSLFDLSLSALTAMISLTIIMIVIGWYLGGPGKGTRKSLALGTSAQSNGLALLITIVNLPAAALSVVAFGLLNIFINMAVAVFWNRQAGAN
jgi:BASS family bile acid:Na+ symporter